MGVQPDGVPYARWKDDGTRPFQLFSRRYGFSFVHARCAIWGRDGVE